MENLHPREAKKAKNRPARGASEEQKPEPVSRSWANWARLCPAEGEPDMRSRDIRADAIAWLQALHGRNTERRASISDLSTRADLRVRLQQLREVKASVARQRARARENT